MGMDFTAYVLWGGMRSLTYLTIPKEPCPTVLSISNSFSRDRGGCAIYDYYELTYFHASKELPGAA
jgi:hypothetical protein